MANITDYPCTENSLTDLFLLWSQDDNDNVQYTMESDRIFNDCLRLVFGAYCQGRSGCQSSLLDGACDKLAADCHDRVDIITSVYLSKKPTATILMWAVICLSCLSCLLLLVIIALFSATNNYRRRDTPMKSEVPIPASADNDTKEGEPDGWMKRDSTKNDWTARSLALGSIKDDLQDVAIIRETNYADKTASFDDSTTNDATPSVIEPLSSTGSNEDDTFWTTMCDV